MYEAEISSRIEKLVKKEPQSFGGYVMPGCKVYYDDDMSAVDTVLPCAPMFCSRCAIKLVKCCLCRTVVSYTTFVLGIERSACWIGLMGKPCLYMLKHHCLFNFCRCAVVSLCFAVGQLCWYTSSCFSYAVKTIILRMQLYIFLSSKLGCMV